MNKKQFKDAVTTILATDVSGLSLDDKLAILRECAIQQQCASNLDDTAAHSAWSDAELRIVLLHAPTKENCIALARAYRRGYGSIEQIFRWAAATNHEVKAKRQGDKFVAQVRRIAKQLGWRA